MCDFCGVNHEAERARSDAREVIRELVAAIEALNKDPSAWLGKDVTRARLKSAVDAARREGWV